MLLSIVVQPLSPAGNLPLSLRAIKFNLADRPQISRCLITEDQLSDLVTSRLAVTNPTFVGYISAPDIPNTEKTADSEAHSPPSSIRQTTIPPPIASSTISLFAKLTE